VAFSTSQFEKRGFRITPIFNGLQPSKITVHPCTVRSLSKNRVFRQAASILLKKPSMAFSTSQFEKRGFRIAPIFNGLQPLKMAVHPCTASSLSKNLVFQQTAGHRTR
jgi:hypothetical protein